MSQRLLALLQITTRTRAWAFLIYSAAMALLGLYYGIDQFQSAAERPADSGDVWFLAVWFLAAGSLFSVAWWALFGASGRASLTAQSEIRAGTFAKIFKMFSNFGFLMAALGVAGILLMAIGAFTVEWTCTCGGPDAWSCKGETCDVRARIHFDATKHTVSCTRTDWPMHIVTLFANLILPEDKRL